MAIKNAYPTNDDNTLYIADDGGISFSDLISRANEHFGSLDNLTIKPEYIHTRCVNYDLYDAMDYDNYIVITKKLL